MLSINKSMLTDLVFGRIEIADFEVGFFRLGAHLSEIDREEVIDIYVNDLSVKGYNFESSNFTFSEHLEKLKYLNGWIHLAGGLAFSIVDQIAVDFRLSKKYLEPCIYVTREEIIRHNGPPDHELLDSMWSVEEGVDNYILVYRRRSLNFFVDVSTGALSEVSTMPL